MASVGRAEERTRSTDSSLQSILPRVRNRCQMLPPGWPLLVRGMEVRMTSATTEMVWEIQRAPP